MMGRRDDFDLNDRPNPLGSILLAVGAVVVAVAVLAGGYFLVFGSKDTGAVEPEVISGVVTGETSGEASGEMPGQAPGEVPESGEDTRETSGKAPGEASSGEASGEASGESSGEVAGEVMETPENGASELLSKVLVSDSVPETAEQTMGIDVSRYQGNIDWKQVAAAGVDFAMIRVGYRAMKTGEIIEDSSARYNLQEASANGIKVGAYFFSTAVSEEEAVEEAEWTADFIAPYAVTYPVAYNCEGYEEADSRQYFLSREERTEFAKAFLNKIYERGYTPMFYASQNELEGDSRWLASELEKSYKVWVSWYPDVAYPQTGKAGYTGEHDMWQYTNNGRIDGIDYAVDVNVAYFGYETAAEPKDSTPPEQVKADVEAGHVFTEVNEVVTAKNATNLRNMPSQGSESKVIYTLKNGETATRTGISASGWSRVIFGGETYYAVSSYLTDDLTVKAPEPAKTPEPVKTPEQDGGIKTQFTPREELVTPKEEVNLRTLPSVTNPQSEVIVKLPYGSVVKRTGINEDLGWSRVEYEGQTLYCVSSYVFVVEE